MSTLSSTTPSDTACPEAGHRGTRPPSRRRTLLTWGLIFLWAFLISFAIAGQFDPQWLRDLSNRGVEVELVDVKNLGDDAFRRGDLGQAITQYKHALSIDPEHAECMLNLGISWIQAGYPERGTTILTEALQKTDSNISRGLIYYALGSVYEQRGSLPQAIRHYQMAADCGTEVDKRCLKLGRLYLADGKLEKARDTFQRALNDFGL